MSLCSINSSINNFIIQTWLEKQYDCSKQTYVFFIRRKQSGMIILTYCKHNNVLNNALDCQIIKIYHVHVLYHFS